MLNQQMSLISVGKKFAIAIVGIGLSIVGIFFLIFSKSTLELLGLVGCVVLFAVGTGGLLLGVGELLTPLLNRFGPRSYLPRFSLRFLLIVCTLIALAVGLPRRRSIAQHYAARILSRPGIEFHFQARGQPQSQLSLAVFGNDQYEFLEVVIVEDVLLSRSDLNCVREFPQLKRLFLEGDCRITDSSLQQIGKIKSLEYLAFGSANVTTDGVRHLQGLPNLEAIRINDTSLRSIDLSGLAKLPKLESLRLQGTAGTSDAVLGLSKCRSLKYVELNHVDLSENGVRQIASIKSLQVLQIRESSITGKGLGAFGDSKSLYLLDLRGSQLTSEGMAEIGQISCVRAVDLRSTPATAEDILALKLAIPNATVISDHKPTVGESESPSN